MKAYSIDLRQKILDTYHAEPISQKALAKRFSVALSFVQKLLKQYRETKNGVAELGYDKFIVRAPKNNTSKNAELMQCPECQSTHVNKNGQKKGKQNYICVGCGRQFIDCYQPHKGYSEEVKRECLKMYVNGMGFRAIERIKGVHHTSIINWVKQVGKLLPDAYEPDTIPLVGELDELETFVGQKK
jgi:transposase-like protein